MVSRLLVLRPTSKRRAVGEPHRGDGHVAFLVLGDTQPDEVRRISAGLQRRRVELHPVRRHIEQDGVADGIRHLHEEALASLSPPPPAALARIAEARAMPPLS